MSDRDNTSWLHKLRSKHGASSPVGNRCSIALQGYQALKTASLEQAPLIQQSILAALDELDAIMTGGDPKAQSRRPQNAALSDVPNYLA